MSAQRLVGLSLLLCAATACAPRGGTQAPKPIKGENGPKGSIHVSYSGGLFFRHVDATFQVDENAYVLVGHLGGDGVIRVLYPENPVEAFRSVRANQRVPIRSFTAAYDGAPSLYSFVRPAFRNLSAMMDSYDGRGHGFVFTIMTWSPGEIDAFSDGLFWNEIDVVDYLRSADPRLAIREFAERFAGGNKYTLKFATSFSTQTYASYAQNAWDCSVLASLGLVHLENFWGSWGRGGFVSHGFGVGTPCTSNRYAYYGGAAGRQYYYAPYVPVYVPRPVGPQPPAPTGRPFTPILTRPSQRAFGEFSRGTLLGRSALDRIDQTRNSGVRRSGTLSPRDEYVRRRAGIHADRPTARPSEGPRASDGPRASAPRGDSPRSSGSTPRTETPRVAAPPQRSNPPATTTPSKTTTTEKKQT